MADLRAQVETARDSINKFEIVRQVLVRINDGGDATLRQRREVLKRVVEFEDFSTCWPDDQLKAKGLVAEIRRVIDVKDSFGRMRQEQEAERNKRLAEERRKAAEADKKRAELGEVKRDLNSPFLGSEFAASGEKARGCAKSALCSPWCSCS